MPADWRIRAASLEDLDAILALELACAEAPHWTRSTWLRVLGSEQGTVPYRVTFVAEADNSILGFAVASCSGEIAELESVAVAGTARRKGIGKSLCRTVKDWSQASGAAEVELEVRASNDGALNLYRSLGFVEQGMRPGYYQRPAEDAVLMIARL
jgi:ribosomal-protein-alanine acetyltransferase